LTAGLTLPSSPPTAGDPWGVARTPLVPSAYRRRYGERMAARELRSAVANPHLTLNELDAGFWNKAPWSTVPSRAFKSLRWQLAQLPVPLDVEVLVSGTPVEQLLALPLGTRAHNFIRVAGKQEESEGRLGRTLTAGDVLAYRNAGVMVLLELLAVVEGDRLAQQPDLRADVNRLAPEQAKPSGDNAIMLPRRLVDLLAAAREFRGATTLKEALEVDDCSLAERTGLAAELNALSLEVLGITEGMSHAAGLLAEIESMQSELTSHEETILQHRLFRRRPATLAALGELQGITRERVRQIESKLKRRFESRLGRRIRIVAGAVAERIAPIARPEDVDRQLGAVFEGRDHAAVPLACRMLRYRLGYRAKGELELNEDASKAVTELRSFAREQQDDAGLLNEEALQSRLVDPSWAKHWELLVETCGFHRIDGLLGLRNTKKARVKAAVLNIGRVASREEIAAKCGLPRQRTVSYLSVLPSVARADRTRWGLTEWIDDVYEGVANEILQRIDEDGGATRVERVLDELPRLFGATEATVRAYLAAPQFEVRNGWVHRADPSSVRLRPLDDAIDGRDELGRPWWTFQVKADYFKGYSLAGLPPEIARELGCPPNGRIEVSLVEPSDCRPLSLSWRLTSLTGPSLGYLSTPLERLGAQPGDRVLRSRRQHRRAGLGEPGCQNPRRLGRGVKEATGKGPLRSNEPIVRPDGRECHGRRLQGRGGRTRVRPHDRPRRHPASRGQPGPLRDLRPEPS